MEQNNKLTHEQQLKVFLTPCSTKKHFAKWIKYFLGLHLPDVTVSRYSDTNPMDVAWEVYDICVNKNNPKKLKEIMYLAGRGSGKTLSMAIVEFMVVVHDQRDVVHVGAIMSQAKRCYDYIKKFMYNGKIKPLLVNKDNGIDNMILQKDTMEKSAFRINDQDVSLEILPCTLKATNGPHVPLVVVDEIDTVTGEAKKAYKEIAGMLDSKGDKQAIRIGISTRKSSYGLMNQQVENALKEGRTVRRWTAFEFHQKCDDKTSGTIKTTYYVCQKYMETLTEQEYLSLSEAKKANYEKHEMFDNCKQCSLSSICLGDAKKQTSKSPMLKPLDELMQKAKSEGTDWSLAQLMNLKPSIEGIIYREFDKDKHVLTWNQMWKKLTGSDYPGLCDHDRFISKCHEMQLPCYAGIDWGWRNPHTVVYLFVDSTENIYIVRSEGHTFISQPAWIHIIKTKYHPIYRASMYFPDIADQGAIFELTAAGLPCVKEIDKTINPGIQVIKKFLHVPGLDLPKMFIAEETNKSLIEEFSKYHYTTATSGEITDEPEDADNHWLDALRYIMITLFGKSTVILGSGLTEKDQVTTSDGKYFSAPTAEQFIYEQQLNISTDKPIEYSKKVGTANELAANEDEDNFGGDGGFFWSF
jgi:hypothetical protein